MPHPQVPANTWDRWTLGEAGGLSPRHPPREPPTPGLQNSEGRSFHCFEPSDLGHLLQPPPKTRTQPGAGPRDARPGLPVGLPVNKGKLWLPPAGPDGGLCCSWSVHMRAHTRIHTHTHVHAQQTPHTLTYSHTRRLTQAQLSHTYTAHSCIYTITHSQVCADIPRAHTACTLCTQPLAHAGTPLCYKNVAVVSSHRGRCA